MRGMEESAQAVGEVVTHFFQSASVLEKTERIQSTFGPR